MSLIENRLDQFGEALNQKLPLVFDKKGKWSLDQTLANRVWRLFLGRQPQLLAIHSQFCLFLDRQEQVPIMLAADGQTLVESQLNWWLKILKIGDCLKDQMIASKLKTETLQRRLVALKARKTLQTQAEQPLGELKAHALSWKASQKLMPTKDLNRSEISLLKRVTRYPDFVALLIEDPALRKDFFLWVLRDKCPVEPFIHYPALCALIKSAHLAPRIGRLGQDWLRIENQDKITHVEKVVTLPFCLIEGTKRISLLDRERLIQFETGLVVTVDKVITCFARKNLEIGDFECFNDGIRLWNSHQLGAKQPDGLYHLQSLSEPLWWQGLPIFQKLTQAQVVAKVGFSPNEGEWIACAKAARDRQNLDFEGRHGYLEILIPCDEDSYQLLSFGKFAAVYPITQFQLVSFLLNTVKSKLSYPDENLFYTHREHASYAFQLTPQQGAQLMEYIRQDLIRAREGNLYFQFACENCAYWVQSTLTKVKQIPNLFKLPILDSYPSQWTIGGAFRMIRRLPKKYRPYLISAVDLILGSWRGINIQEGAVKVFKSVFNHPLYKEQSIYQAGYLHEQIKAETLTGKIASAFEA